RFGRFWIRADKRATNNRLHIAIIAGAWKDNEKVLTRINSTLTNKDMLGMPTNNIVVQPMTMKMVITDVGKESIIFINQEAKSTEILSRLAFLKDNQKNGEVTKVPKINMDNRDFGIGAQILHDLNIHKLRLISNSQQTKRVGMIGYGLEIVEYVNY